MDVSRPFIQPIRVPDNAGLPHVSPPDHNSDLSVYYQKMAEDYRSSFLNLEKDYHFLKRVLDTEQEKLKGTSAEIERQYT